MYFTPDIQPALKFVTGLCAPGLVLTGCASYPLHANLADTDLRQRLDADFAPGMTLDEVHGHLDGLRVSDRYRWLYEPTRATPPQLLVRLFRPGGFWIRQDDELVEWVDAVFVLDDERRLERVVTERGGQRYFHGEPVFIPDRPTRYPTRRYPHAPPPPAEPPVSINREQP